MLESIENVKRFVIKTIITAGVGLFLLRKVWIHNRLKNKIVKDLSEKIVIITGSSDGIGMQAANELAKMGATIIFACRDENKTQRAIAKIRRATNNSKLRYMHIDLENSASIKKFADEFMANYQKLDILINNAGISLKDRERKLTSEGHELHFAVNYLGHFHLTRLLLSTMKATPSSRIINVSSELHKRVTFFDMANINLDIGYSNSTAYRQSKLLQVMFTNHLQRLLDENGLNIKTVAISPGFCRTKLITGRFSWKTIINVIQTRLILLLALPFYYYVSRTAWEGAQVILYTSVLDFDILEKGGYYRDNTSHISSGLARNSALAAELWDISSNLCNLPRDI